jgi:hypothetical protein
MTRGTSGQHGSTSLRSAALQSSLESRLKRRLGTAGSTLFKMTWKNKATPAHRSVCLLRASGHRTSDSGFGSWPTTIAALADKGVRSTEGGIREAMRTSGADLAAMVTLASWPTTTQDAASSGALGYGGQKFMTLTDAARQSAWPTTTTTRDWKSNASNLHGVNARPLNEVARLASWGTPTVMDALPIRTDAQLARAKSVAGCSNIKDQIPSGPPATGSPAETAKPGQLNPAHSRWLMGYPPEWDACAPTATRSSRKSRPR